MMNIYKIKHLLKNTLTALLLSDEKRITQKFKQRLGYKPNLTEPKTFNEKIQWRKINDRNPLYTLCSDKYLVRDYVEQKIGAQYLIPLVGVYNTFAEINFSALPNEFALKANHGSGCNLIVTNKAELNWPKQKGIINNWLGRNYYYHKREWQYKDIKPLIVIEELLKAENGAIPEDIKVHCFMNNNESELFIQIDHDRFGEHTRSFYDSNWNKLDMTYNTRAAADIVDKPNCLDEILTVAKKLSEDFSYVRVDLYIVKNNIFFGELTFSPGSGFKKFHPESADLEWGAKFPLLKYNSH